MRRLLTVIAVAAAVLGAAACQHGKEPAAVKTSALADSADQVMFGAHAILTDQGLMRADLFGDTAFFFDDNTRIEMHVVKTIFYTTQGATNTFSSSVE